MGHRKWVPTTERGQMELLRRWKEGLEKADWQARFGWPEGEVDALVALIESAESARAEYVAVNSSAHKIEKDAGLKEAIAGIRGFAWSYIRHNKKMPREYRQTFGIDEPDRERTPRGVPSTRPVIFTVKALGGCGVEIYFQDESTPDSHAIPEAYNGAVLYYAWGTEKIDDVTRLTHSELMTRHRWRLTLPPEAEASWLSLAACWQSGGRKGRFSGIYHIAVS